MSTSILLGVPAPPPPPPAPPHDRDPNNNSSLTTITPDFDKGSLELLKCLDVIDEPFCAEALLVGIPLVTFAVSLVVCFVKPYKPFLDDSILRTVTDDAAVAALCVSSATVAMSLPFMCSIGCEIVSGALRNRQRRLDIFARLIYVISIAMPAFVLIPLLVNGYKQQVCMVCVYVLEYQSLWILCGALLTVAHRDEWCAKPRILIPLIAMHAFGSVTQHFVDIELHADSAGEFAYSVLNMSTYGIGAVCLWSMVMHLRRLACGGAISARAYDAIYITSIIITWYVIIRAFARTDPTSDARYASFNGWVSFDLLGGTVFLFISDLRSTNVIMKRIGMRRIRGGYEGVAYMFIC